MNKKRLKKVSLALGTIATAAAPVAAVVACGKKSIDLTKNIVVLSQPKKDSDGNVSYPMDTVWNKAIKNFKDDFPSESKSFNVKVLHLDYAQYEKLSTVGITGQSMPDVWYFPSDKADMLQRKNKALVPLTKDMTNRILSKSGIKNNPTLESIDGKDIGLRFKNETVNLWGNKKRLIETFPGNTGAATMIDKLFKANPSFTDAGGTAIAPGDNALKGSVEDFFAKLENGAGANTKQNPNKNFDDKKQSISKAFGENLDIEKIGQVMENAASSANSNDPNSAENQLFRSLLPVDGGNGWWFDALIYAKDISSVGTIDGKKVLQGLIWDKTPAPKSKTRDYRSVLASVNDNTTDVPKIVETYYNLASKSNKNNTNQWNEFQDGLNAFAFQGTWGQKDFPEGFIKQAAKSGITSKKKQEEFAEKNLFAFPLPLVAGHQMRHYQQGWNFGINSRNRIEGNKFKATEDLLAEVFSPDVQKTYYDNVEWINPGNLADISVFGKKPSYVKPVLDTVKANPQKYTVDQSQIDPAYGQVGNGTDGWGTIYGEILKPIKKDKSGKVTVTWAKWSQDITKYLTKYNIKGIKG